MADVVGLLRSVRNDEADMLTRAISRLTIEELCQCFIASLAIMSKLADALDQEREATGQDPIADTLLARLAEAAT